MYYILRILYILYILYLIIMLYIDMLYIILHDPCLHHSNVCDIDRNSFTLLFNLYMQCHYIAYLGGIFYSRY